MAPLNRTLINLATIAVLAALLLGFLWYSDTGIAPQAAVENEIQRPDFFLINSHSLQFDQAGLPDTRMQSIRLEHVPADNSVSMQQPRIDTFRQGEQRWTLTAKTGLISPAGDEVDLQQEVNIDSSDKLTSLTTQQLTVIPDKKQAQTDQPVTLRGTNGITEAIGLEADLLTETMVLPKRVNSRYQPAVLERN